MKEKIIKDSKQRNFLNWIAYFMLIVGLLSGILLVSVLKNGEINWTVTGASLAFSVLVFFALLLIRVEVNRAAVK